jgi:hypothetical protein
MWLVNVLRGLIGLWCDCLLQRGVECAILIMLLGKASRPVNLVWHVLTPSSKLPLHMEERSSKPSKDKFKRMDKD